MSQVTEALEAWRAAARRLDVERDPKKRVRLEAEADAFQVAYRAAVEAEMDVSAHADEKRPSGKATGSRSVTD